MKLKEEIQTFLNEFNFLEQIMHIYIYKSNNKTNVLE